MVPARPATRPSGLGLYLARGTSAVLWWLLAAGVVVGVWYVRRRLRGQAALGWR